MVKNVLETIRTSFLLFFFFTLVTGPRRSLSLKLSDTRTTQREERDGDDYVKRRIHSGDSNLFIVEGITFHLA